ALSSGAALAVRLAMRSLMRCLATVVAACGGGGGGGDDEPDAGISASCQEATQHDDLAWIETNVFARSCTFMACHQGAAMMANGLTLQAGQSHAELVGRPSMTSPGMTL